MSASVSQSPAGPCPAPPSDAKRPGRWRRWSLRSQRSALRGYVVDCWWMKEKSRRKSGRTKDARAVVFLLLVNAPKLLVWAPSASLFFLAGKRLWTEVPGPNVAQLYQAQVDSIWNFLYEKKKNQTGTFYLISLAVLHLQCMTIRLTLFSIFEIVFLISTPSWLSFFIVYNDN